jgi:hypothetical protein
MIFPASRGKTPQQLLENTRLQFARANVIQKKKRFGPKYGDVVDAMIDKVPSHGVMAVHGEGDFKLGANAIGARNEHGLAEFFDIQFKQTTEPTHAAQDLTAPGGSEQLRQSRLDPVAQVNIDTRRSVSFLTHVGGTLPSDESRDKLGGALVASSRIFASVTMRDDARHSLGKSVARFDVKYVEF